MRQKRIAAAMAAALPRGLLAQNAPAPARELGVVTVTGGQPTSLPTPLELPPLPAAQLRRGTESRFLRTPTMHKLLALLPLCGALAAAEAHVVLEYQVAPANASYKATFKVGHGCGKSPTRQLTVEIPAGMRNPHPMPKPGWTLEMQGGGEARTTFTWTAKTDGDKLASAFYDEFVVVARTPEQAGPVYWPVRQVCDEGRHDWVEVPASGQKLSDLKSPAAVLEVLPAGGAGGHHH